MDGSPEEGIKTSVELAEVDRRLALLRSELAPAGCSGPEAAPAAALAAETPPAAALAAESVPSEAPDCEEAAASSTHVVRAELHAGPFADPEAVRAFARLLCELRAVVDVRLAGYEGADRAILEVTLAGDEAARRRATPSA
jgi:hypothetical protein